MDKQTITFSANEQTLIKTGGTCNYSSNKVAYIEAQFDLGTNWSGYDSIRAIWYNSYRTVSTVLDSLGNCIVPYEVLTRRGKVLVNLVGSIVEDDELTDRLTSYPVIALIVDADAKVNGDTAQPITPSEYEQFVAAVGADADRAEQSATDSYNSATASAGSASDSEASAIRAEQARDASEGYASDASGYASDASESARLAAESEGNASQYANDAEAARDTILGMRAEATTLPAGSSATASYSEGVLSLGIPKGDKGDKGDKGNKGDTGATGNGIASIAKTGTSGLVDTYTVTFTNGNTTTFDVTNGNGIASVALTDTSGLTKTYTITFTDGSTTTFMVQDGEVTEASLISVLTQYALETGKYFTDTEPYTFRSAPSGDYNREADTVVGGSVGWNQLVENLRESRTVYGLTFTNNGDGSATITGTANASGNVAVTITISLISTHKYYLSNGITESFVTGIASYQFVHAAVSGTTYNVTYRPQITDLTQMFPTNIADYVYGLGATNGLAYLRKYGFLTKSYYPYDSGSIQSVSGVSAHKMVGFNQWDEEWEVGKIDGTTGNNVSSNDRIRSKNYIPVIPNTTYYVKMPSNGIWVYWYNADKVYSTRYNRPANTTFTTPSDCYYIRFETYTEYGTTYNHDICINLSKTTGAPKNGDYEPYTAHSYPLDSTLTLRGVPKLNASNQLYFDGDRYESDGTVTRRYGIVDLGTLDWLDASIDHLFTATLGDMVTYGSVDIMPNWLVQSRYTLTTTANYYSWEDKPDKVIGARAGSKYVQIKDSAYSDGATLKTSLSGVYLVYEKATPTTETAEPFQSPQIADPSGTEEYVTTSIVPVGHETRYPTDLLGKLEQLSDIPEPPSTNGTYQLEAVVSGGQVTYIWS